MVVSPMDIVLIPASYKQVRFVEAQTTFYFAENPYQVVRELYAHACREHILVDRAGHRDPQVGAIRQDAGHRARRCC